MSAGSLCSRVVATAAPQETVRAAARRMVEHDVGTVVVLDPTAVGKPVGILTDRDITLRCVAAGLDPEREVVGALMTQPLQTVEEHEPIETAIGRMARFGSRRLVVVNAAGRIAGLLSLDDILYQLTENAAGIGRLLARQQPLITA